MRPFVSGKLHPGCRRADFSKENTFLNCSVTMEDRRGTSSWKRVLSAPRTDSFWKPARSESLCFCFQLSCVSAKKLSSAVDSPRLRAFCQPPLFKQAACQRAALTYPAPRTLATKPDTIPPPGGKMENTRGAAPCFVLSDGKIKAKQNPASSARGRVDGGTTGGERLARRCHQITLSLISLRSSCRSRPSRGRPELSGAFPTARCCLSSHDCDKKP